MFWMDKKTLYSVEMAQMQGKEQMIFKDIEHFGEKQMRKNV